MRIPFMSVKLLTVATLTGIGFVSLLIPQPSSAEPSQVLNLPNYDPQNNTDDPYNSNNNPFSSSNTDNSFSVFNLIHRANLAVPNLDVNAQNQQLNEATEAFKAKQRALTQQGQQQQTPVFQLNRPLGNTPGINQQ